MSNQTVDLQIRVTSSPRLKQALMQLSNQAYYRGMFRDVLTDVLKTGLAYAKAIVHKRTGNLADALIYTYNSHAMRGTIEVSKRIAYARGSRVQWPSIYALYEERRGGEHAFLSRTYNESILPAGLEGTRVVIRELGRL